MVYTTHKDKHRTTFIVKYCTFRTTQALPSATPCASSALLDDETELRRLVALLVAVAQAEGVPLGKARDAQAVIEQIDAEPVDRRVAQLPAGSKAVEQATFGAASRRP